MTTKLLTTSEAAELLGMTKAGIYGLVHKRKIPFYKPSKKLLYFTQEELINWAMSNRLAPNQELESEAGDGVQGSQRRRGRERNAHRQN